MVRVQPERTTVDRLFDYLVPQGMVVSVGERVRVPLGGRKVGGWVVAAGVTPPSGVKLRALVASRGLGPSPELVDLAAWAAWRWAGPLRAFLGAASPPTIVRAPSPPPGGSGARTTGVGVSSPTRASLEGEEAELVREAIAKGAAVIRDGAAADPWPYVRAVLATLGGRGSVLVLVPQKAGVDRLEALLRADGIDTAKLPGGWARATGGAAVVLGSRAGAWGPASGLAAVVVVDVHDEAWKETRAPTWDAVEVSLERARRAGAAWIGLSCCPPPNLAHAIGVVGVSRAKERAGWAPLGIVDMGKLDPRTGLLSGAVVDLARRATPESPAILVLNRKGRASMTACGSCGELSRCEGCGTALRQDAKQGELSCPLCGLSRPVVCAACGSLRLKLVRPGVSRLAEELGALVRTPVVEITSASPPGEGEGAGVIVGTEAALHRIGRASGVAFLDFDQELFAAHHGAGQAALCLLATASRAVRGRAGMVVVQTRARGHEVFEAVLHADPGRFLHSELARRRDLSLPPFSALALIGGAGAADWVGRIDSVEVAPLDEARWLVRAGSHEELSNALGNAGKPPPRTRVEVDPIRV